MTEARDVNILLIEDDPDDVLFMQMFLSSFVEKDLRFVLDCADRLEAGLDRLETRSYDVILLDLMLPDSSGIETFLRVIATRPDSAVIVLTGYNDEKAALESVRLGAQDYVNKANLTEGLLKKVILYGMERRRMVSHLEGIIAAAADGMVVVDAEGLVRYLNPAAEKLFGVKADAMLGRPYTFELPEAGQTRETRLNASDDSSRVLETRATVIEWKKQPGRLVALRDISDLQKLEQLKAEVRERRKVEIMKDEFFTSVSHELRSPLTVVKAAISNLRTEKPGPLNEKQAAILHLGHRSLKRLVRFVNNILNLAGLENGKVEPRRKSLNLSILVREALTALELEEGKLAVTAVLPDALPSVEGDSDMVAEVLGNLVENASRYAKSRVTVSAAALTTAGAGSGGGFIEVTVADDGPGLRPEDIPVIFDRFARVKKMPGSTGVGIGLSLCKEIIEKHGGRIWAENVEGQGAAFHFTLPAVK